MRRFDEYQQLKKEYADATRDAERKKAALDHELARAREELGVMNTTGLEKLLKRKNKELDELEREHAKRVEEFKEFSDKLDEEEE